MASGKVFEAVVSIAGQIDPSLEKSISKAQKSTSGLGKGLKIAGAVGAAGVAAVGAASVAMAVKATESAAEYQESFAKTATLLSGTQEELEKYSQSILGLSNDTGIAASELTETVYSAISAGVDQENAVEFAGEAAKLAAGGFTDSATAVDVMTTALNAYGLEADNAGQISDYLITTQNLGKTTVDELASSVGKVIPIASAYGVEMDNLSTAYAQLTAGGIATAEAGTYLKSMLNELGDSGSNVSRILQEETGMGFAELTESGKSLGDVMDILGNSVGGDSGAFNELWSSSEAGVGALSLLNSGAEAYNDTLGKMRSSAGATDSAYGTMTNTLSHQIQTIKNLGQNFLTSIGQKILPTVSTMAQSAIPLISKALDGVAGAADKILPGIMSGFESFLPVLEQISSTALPQIESAFNALAPVIQTGIESALPILQEVASSVLPMFSGMISAVAPLVQTLFSVVLGVLPTVISVFYKIQGVVWGVIEKLMPDVTALLDEVGGLIQELVDLVMPFIEDILDAISPVVDLLISSIVPILKIIIQIAGQIIRVVMQVLAAVLPVVTQIIQIVAELYLELLSQLMPSLMQIFDAITPIINAAMQIISAILPVIIAILNALMPILKVVANILSAVLGVAIKVVIGYWNTIIGAVNSAITTFKGIITYLQGFVSSWTGIWTTVTGAVSSAFSGLVGVVKGPINTIIGMVNGVINKINGAGFTIPDWVPEVGGKSFKVSVATLPMFATGGHTEGPSIAGEAGTETVISYDPRFRDQNIEYWKQAGQMLGINMTNVEGDGLLARILGIFSKLSNMSMSARTGTMLAKDEGFASVLETGNISNSSSYQIDSIQFNPTIIIQGNASEKDVKSALTESKEEFFDKLDEWWDEKTGGGDYEPKFA